MCILQYIMCELKYFLILFDCDLSLSQTNTLTEYFGDNGSKICSKLSELFPGMIQKTIS